MPPKDLSGALRTVLNILDAWDISTQDRLALLGCSQGTYDRWVEMRELWELRPDTLDRLSYILGIWKALQTMFPDPAAANTWIHRPNTDPLFGGQAPLAFMAKGQIECLSRVRRFLDGWCN